MNIEIGGKRTLEGWRDMSNRGGGFNIITDEFDMPDDSVDNFYMSHVIEHIPVACAPKVCTKMLRKLKKGGKLRLLTPDLKQIAQAYVNNDIDKFSNDSYQWSSISPIYNRLGIGGCFLSQILSTGNDTALYDYDGKRQLTTFAHVACYDYDMLHGLLTTVGYSKIERTGTCPIMDLHHDKKGQLCLNAYK